MSLRAISRMSRLAQSCQHAAQVRPRRAPRADLPAVARLTAGAWLQAVSAAATHEIPGQCNGRPPACKLARHAAAADSRVGPAQVNCPAWAAGALQAAWRSAP
jgi:hypothetical protein